MQVRISPSGILVSCGLTGSGKLGRRISTPPIALQWNHVAITFLLFDECLPQVLEVRLPAFHKRVISRSRWVVLNVQ